jgi:hypothetical protein
MASVPPGGVSPAAREGGDADEPLNYPENAKARDIPRRRRVDAGRTTERRNQK